MRRYLITIALAAVVGGGLAVALALGGSVAEAGQDDARAVHDTDRLGALDEVLDELVEDEVITEEQAEAVGEALRDRLHPYRQDRHHGHRSQPGRATLETIAGVIGIDETSLLDELNDGRTIAEIAEDNGSSAAAVVDALAAQHEEHFEDLVKDGRVSEERASEMRVYLRERLEAFVAGDDPTPHDGFHRRHGYGFDGPRYRTGQAGITV